MKVVPVQIGCGVAPAGKGLAANGPVGHTPRVGEGLPASDVIPAPGVVPAPGVDVAPSPPGLAIPTTLGPSELGEPAAALPLGGRGCAFIAPAALPAAPVALPWASPEPPEGASVPAVCSVSELLEQASEPPDRAKNRHERAAGEVRMRPTIVASHPCGKADPRPCRPPDGFHDSVQLTLNDPGATPWIPAFTLTLWPRAHGSLLGRSPPRSFAAGCSLC